jgi:hypothetical protein
MLAPSLHLHKRRQVRRISRAVLLLKPAGKASVDFGGDALRTLWARQSF